MAYKYHKEPHELFSNRARLRKPTEKEKKWIDEYIKESNKFIKECFPEIDLEKTTLKRIKVK